MNLVFSVGRQSLLLGLLLAGAMALPATAQELETTPLLLAQSPTPSSAAELKTTATSALQFWSSQDFQQLQKLLSPSLQALLPPSELKRFWQIQAEDVGQIKTIGSPRLVNAVTAKLVLVPVVFERLSADVVVTFNQNNQIAGINFPTRANIQAIAENSVKAMASGDLVKARDYFHPTLKAEISPQQLQQKWDLLQKEAGQFVKISKLQVQLGTSLDEFNLVLVTVKFAKVTDDLILIFDRQKQIVGVDFPFDNL
jgi:Protein of unknown function (DUF3887)